MADLKQALIWLRDGEWVRRKSWHNTHPSVRLIGKDWLENPDGSGHNVKDSRILIEADDWEMR